MKKTAAVLFFFGALLSGNVLAATPQEIEQVTQRLSDIQVLQGRFNQQKKLQGLAYPLVAEGEFIFWKAQGLYIATEKPFFNALTLTGTATLNWQADGTGSIAQEQTAIIQREINKTLLAFFSADLALIEQRFSSDWLVEKNQWQLTLTPKLDVIQKNMRKVVMSGQQFLQKLVVVSANGDETSIEFHAQIESRLPTSTQCRWFYLQPQTPCAHFAAPPPP